MAKFNHDLRENIKLNLNELASKIETKSSELVRQIAQEHQERVRSQEAMFGQIDLRSKILEEKILYEKEEMREKYLTLEGFTKNEFKRKDESIHHLTEDMEKYFMRSEKQIEFYKNEIFKTHMAFEEQVFSKTSTIDSDIDGLKKAINGEYEKIGEIIKEEINARFSSDVYGN